MERSLVSDESAPMKPVVLVSLWQTITIDSTVASVEQHTSSQSLLRSEDVT